MITEKQIKEIIRPAPERAWQADFPLNWFEKSLIGMAKDFGGGIVNMEPDFQRGHVWTDGQRLKFIEAFVRGFIPKHLLTVQFNCPMWNNEKSIDLPNEIQCIDGLQRITAFRKFLNGEIRPFGFKIKDLDGTSVSCSRLSRTILIQIHAFTRKKDLIRYYLDLNEGATPHTDQEIQRVKLLIK